MNCPESWMKQAKLILHFKRITCLISNPLYSPTRKCLVSKTIHLQYLSNPQISHKAYTPQNGSQVATSDPLIQAYNSQSSPRIDQPKCPNNHANNTNSQDTPCQPISPFAMPIYKP
ncbi:hypothetical protein RJ641_004249 [Dillenia turbinata]|uniref:Uncharacterized protein n=1 Tax=Dillenia turbinata TaxID=194707 RepID=A0AAN8V9Q0_9MAGN